MPDDTHASLLAGFAERHALNKVRLAELLGLPEPAKGGRVTVTRWINGEPCSIPLPTLRAALAELERQMGQGARKRRQPG